MTKHISRFKRIGYFDSVDEALEKALETYRALKEEGFFGNGVALGQPRASGEPRIWTPGYGIRCYLESGDYEVNFSVSGRENIESKLGEMIGHTVIPDGDSLYIDGRTESTKPEVYTSISIRRDAIGILRKLSQLKIGRCSVINVFTKVIPLVLKPLEDKIVVSVKQEIYNNHVANFDPRELEITDIRKLF